MRVSFHCCSLLPLADLARSLMQNVLPVGPEAVVRFDMAAVARGGETVDTHVDAHGLAVWHGLLEATLSLDREKSVAA